MHIGVVYAVELYRVDFVDDYNAFNHCVSLLAVVCYSHAKVVIFQQLRCNRGGAGIKAKGVIYRKDFINFVLHFVAYETRH